MSNELHGRTHYQTLLEARFGARYNELNEGLYRLLDRAFTALALLAAAGAFINLVAKIPGLTEIAGLGIAVAGIIQALMGPGGRSVEHRELGRRFHQLVARAPSLDVATLDREVNELRAGAPAGFEMLNPVAQNDVLRSAGHEQRVHVNFWHHLVAFLT
jgi:hypothetical protein